MKLLPADKTLGILTRYKIPVPKTKIIGSKKELFKAAKLIGFPLFIKVNSPDIAHKTDIGAVKKAENEEQLLEAYDQIIKNTRKKMPKARIKGVILQEVKTGKEVIIGVKKDPQFNTVMLFGLGGIFVEVFKDISLRIIPIDEKDADEMIKEIKGYQILKGARDEKPINFDELKKIMVNVSKLVANNKNISEMDLNPVMVNQKEAVAVDFKIMEE